MRSWLVVPLFIAGCGSVDGPADSVDPVPYILDEPDPPIASLSPAQLASAVDAAVTRAVSLSVQPVLDAYLAAVEGRDPACPAWAEEGLASQWYGSCVSQAGTRFDGFAGTESYEGIGETGNPEWAVSLYASATIVTADDHTFQGGGSVYMGGGQGEASAWSYDNIAGAFRWDGPEAAGTWLQDGTEADLARYWTREDWGQAVQLGGAVVGPDGTAVSFSELTFINTVCPQEPGGTVSVRGDDGWYDIVFDLDLEGEMDQALCDGCGTAWFRGERVGQVCVDLAWVAAFTGSPW